MYDLPTLVAKTRRRRRMDLRAAAEAIGCAPSTLWSVENGGGCNMRTLILLMHWIEHT